MRKLTVLAALALGTAAVPADAAIVQYGLAFERTTLSFDSRGGDPSDFFRNPSGTFSFDTTANRLLSFDVYAGYSTTAPVSLNDQALALFTAAGPCDLSCFIGAVNAGSWGTGGGTGRVETRFSFGAPLNGTISAAAPGPSFFFSISGTSRVTGPVPEPGTWALLLLGFGMIGSAVRRQRKLTVSYS